MKRVLLVEDEFDLAELVQIILESAGFEVTLASDGREAIAWLADHVPDVVLTDFMLPFADGGEVIKHLKTDPRLSKVPAILMSAAATIRDGIQGDAFLKKPFHPNALLSCIASVLPA